MDGPDPSPDDPAARGTARLPKTTKGNHYLVFPWLTSDLSGPEPCSRVLKIREPRDRAIWYDRRILHEEALLEHLAGLEQCKQLRIPQVVIMGKTRFQLYVPGRTLGKRLRGVGGFGAARKVPGKYVHAVTALTGALARVGHGDIPDALWRVPEHRDTVRDESSSAFLSGLVAHAMERAYGKDAEMFADLYDELGIEAEALKDIAAEASQLTDRPYCLLHGDLHRENIIVDPEDEVWFIDWELAAVGDPLYELATHLHLMGYPKDQQSEVIEHWRETVGKVLRGSDAGLDEDLPRYARFKRIQSVYTDVQRQAHAIRNGESPLRDLQPFTAGHKVRQALLNAPEVLAGRPVPSHRRIAGAYRAWLKKHPRPSEAPVASGE